MEYDKKRIGKRIREERKKIKLNQENFGWKLRDYNIRGFNRETVAKWEKGEALPSLDILLKMSEIFDCEIGYLLCEFDTKTRLSADIQQETGLSEDEIEILRNEYSKAQELLGVKNPTTKTRAIGKFIRACDPIAEELDYLLLLDSLPNAFQVADIDAEAVAEIYYSVRADDTLQEFGKWTAFRTRFLQKYPDWDNDDYIMGLYMTFHAGHAGEARESRTTITLEFDRIIGEFLKEEKQSR